jgi:DNA replication protein DnaC
MSAPAKTQAIEALIEAHAVELKLPTVRRRFRTLADEALREQQTPVAYLAALLEAEMTERSERREKRRLIDARFPVIKRLEDFRFQDNPKIPQATIAALAEGSWIDDRESVILIGESGTGKTMLATALAVCACQQGRRVRFTPSPASQTSYKKPTAAANSPESSPATPAPNSSSSTNSGTSRSPKAPPSSSSKSSPSATNAPR